MKIQGGKILVLLFLLSGFFCCQKNIRADSEQVVINEIAWMGTEVSSNDEWIELRNMTSIDIDLEGWKIIAQDGSPEINLSGIILADNYFLLERTDDGSVSNVLADLIYVGAFGNIGEALELRDNNDLIVDIVDASLGWQAGDNDTKQTMERIDGNGWQTSDVIGGSPKNINTSPQLSPYEGEGECGDGVLDDIEECDDGNLVLGDGCDSECSIEEQGEDPLVIEEPIDEEEPEVVVDILSYKLGDIVFNEFVSDPADEEVEWIELYNKTGEEIDLEGWSIEEGSESKTTLLGIINKFFVIEKPKGNLNNKGDIIILRDNNNNLIDKLVYGDWDDGDINNNAPVASDPFSVARIIDGNNTFNNLNDFKVTKKLTKGESNIIEENTEVEEELSEEEMSNYDYSNDIVISEIMPNPYGIDSEGEFIELYNQGEKDVDLRGWRIGDNTSKRYELKGEDTLIKAREYYVVHRSSSAIAFNNSSDSAKLYQPLRDEAFIEIEYQDVIEGWSYVNDQNNWFWTEIVTPGEENIIETINYSPVVDFYCPEEYLVNSPIIFDSSDTVDPENDELKFTWDFGDEFTSNFVSPEHTFTREGVYVVKVIVSDGENEVDKENIIKILPYPNPLLQRRGENDEEGVSLPAGRQGEVIINEILPNPEGTDRDGEFIELKNNSTQRINLLNWQLDDSEGGSRPYTINSDAWIDIEEYLLIHRTESGLALNNTFDSARLFNSFNELIDSIDYENVIEGESYARGKNGKWFWTEVITPETENIISTSEKRLGISDVKSKNSSVVNKNIINTYIETDLEKVREFESGDFVKTKGTVAVLPGVFGTQYFYIVGSPGIQVYNYKKDFPDMEIGDYVEVTGEIAVTNGEKRIKTKTKEDIVKLSKQEDPKSSSYTCEKICDDNLGELVTVTGEIVDQKSSTLWLDDGTDEVLIYIKSYTGINAKDYKEGEMVEITGIVGMAKSGLRIMPRSRSDIVKKDGESQDVGRVLGEVAVNDEWEITKRDKKIELFKYLLIIAGGVIFVLSGLLVREVRK